MIQKFNVWRVLVVILFVIALSSSVFFYTTVQDFKRNVYAGCLARNQQDLAVLGFLRTVAGKFPVLQGNVQEFQKGYALRDCSKYR